MNALENGMLMEMVFEAIADETGYQRKTTFASDFGIADCYGTDAVKDTYKRALESWKTDIEYMTELCLALNWACWYHYDNGNIELSMLYSDLYHECDEYILDNFKDDDLKYYLKVTD